MEILQFTYFQQLGAWPQACFLRAAYGLERIALQVQQRKARMILKDNNHPLLHKDLFWDNEDQSTFSFERAINQLLQQFNMCIEEGHALLTAPGKRGHIFHRMLIHQKPF